MNDPITTAELLVADRVAAREGNFDADIYTVWFCYILGGWKALVSTDIGDGRYYEVTYDRAKRATYIDTYVKESNEAVPDMEEDDLLKPRLNAGEHGLAREDPQGALVCYCGLAFTDSALLKEHVRSGG